MVRFRLSEHMKIVHEKKKKVTCSYIDCQKSFFYNHQLERHIQKKHVEKVKMEKKPKVAKVKVVEMVEVVEVQGIVELDQSQF